MLLYMPTKVYSEAGCVKKHGKEMAAFGEMAMIVTGRHSAKANGSQKDVEEVLSQEGISYILFDEVEENPSIETIMRARDIGIKEQVDFVIGIGGGSPLDAAKAIALMIANPGETQDVFYDEKKLSHLPVVCIPTTCGTGSEVTPYSILTIHKKQTKKGIKHRVYPALALLDANYLKSMSRECIINTCVDALAHLLESYLNTNSNEWNRTYSREGLMLWGEFKERLQRGELQEEDYEKMLRASSLAGMAITHTGTSIPHGLSYPITYELKMPHGKAVGIFLAGFVRRYEDKNEVNQALSYLGFESVSEFTSYMQKLLGRVAVEEALLKTSISNLLSDPAKLKNYPYSITAEELRSILIRNRCDLFRNR